jgi:hypothetical protein
MAGQTSSEPLPFAPVQRWPHLQVSCWARQFVMKITLPTKMTVTKYLIHYRKKALN